MREIIDFITSNVSVTQVLIVQSTVHNLVFRILIEWSNTPCFFFFQDSPWIAPKKLGERVSPTVLPTLFMSWPLLSMLHPSFVVITSPREYLGNFLLERWGKNCYVERNHHLAILRVS